MAIPRTASTSVPSSAATAYPVRPLPRMPRAAILRRVSTDEQRQGWSLSSQQADAESYCLRHNYVIVDDVEEVDSGDLLDERDGLWRVRQHALAGLIDVVVVWKLDRLSRNVQNQQVLLYEFGVVARRRNGASVRVESLTERIDDTEAGHAYMLIAGIVGEWERKNFRARSIRNKLARVQAGKPLPGRCAPFGYRWGDAEHSYLLAEPPASQTVRDIFAWAEAGEPMRAIANRLTAARITTPDGKAAWNARTIAYILRNPAYYGELTAYRWATRTVEGAHALTGRGWQRKYPVAQPDASRLHVLPGVAEALVTKAQAERADAQLRAKALHPTATRTDIADAYLLAHGFARCGHCGATMAALNRVQRVKRPDGSVREYHYRNYQCSGEGCSHKQIGAPVEDWVWAQAQALLANPAPLWQQLDAHAHQYITPTASRVEALSARLAEIADEAAALATALSRMTGKRGTHYLEDALERLGHEEAETRRKLAVAEEQHTDWKHARQVLAALLSGASVHASTLQEKRLALRALGVAVTMYRTGHQPRWTFESAPFTAQRPPAKVPTKNDMPDSAYLEKNSTIIFPLPIDLVEPLAELLRRGAGMPPIQSARPASATPSAPSAPRIEQPLTPVSAQEPESPPA